MSQLDDAWRPLRHFLPINWEFIYSWICLRKTNVVYTGFFKCASEKMDLSQRHLEHVLFKAQFWLPSHSHSLTQEREDLLRSAEYMLRQREAELEGLWKQVGCTWADKPPRSVSNVHRMNSNDRIWTESSWSDECLGYVGSSTHRFTGGRELWSRGRMASFVVFLWTCCRQIRSFGSFEWLDDWIWLDIVGSEREMYIYIYIFIHICVHFMSYVCICF